MGSDFGFWLLTLSTSFPIIDCWRHIHFTKRQDQHGYVFVDLIIKLAFIFSPSSVIDEDNSTWHYLLSPWKCALKQIMWFGQSTNSRARPIQFHSPPILSIKLNVLYTFETTCSNEAFYTSVIFFSNVNKTNPCKLHHSHTHPCRCGYMTAIFKGVDLGKGSMMNNWSWSLSTTQWVVFRIG